MTEEKMKTLTLAPEWLPKCRMKRIICHWTAGAYEPTELDKEHYHFLIDGTAKLHRGRYTVADNVSTADGRYAAHTRNCNTGSIGIAACCMAGAKSSPFAPGQYPLTLQQWVTMAQLAAQLAQCYDIPVSPQTILGHGEVEKQLGIPQLGKWDPMKLPFEPALTPAQVGQRLRERVSYHLANLQPEKEPPCTVILYQKKHPGLITNGTTYVSAEYVFATLNVTKYQTVADHTLQYEWNGQVYRQACHRYEGEIFLSCRQLATILQHPISFQRDENGNAIVRIGN